MKNNVIERIKKIISLITVLICVFSLMFSLSAVANEDETTQDVISEVKTSDLIYIDNNMSFAATIKYKNNDVDITFIMPDGTEIDANTDGVSKDNYSIKKNETSTTIIVMNAQNGQWQIRYDKGSNESLSVSFSEIAKQTFFITSLEMNVNEFDKYEYNLDFIVSTKENEEDIDYDSVYYDYQVYIKSKSNTYEPRLMKEGTDLTENTVSISVDLSHVNSSSDYYFEVVVTANINGFEFNDFATTEEFTFENDKYSLDVSKNYSFLLNLTSGIGNVTCEDYISYGSVIYASIYIDNKLVENFEFSRNLKTSQFLFDNESKIVRLEVYREEDGFKSEVYVEEIKIKDESGFSVIWPEKSLLYSHALEIGYKNAKNTSVEVWGYNSNNENDRFNKTLEGDGELTVNLIGDETTVHFAHNVDNVKYEVYKSFKIDTITPNITIYNKIDGVYTDKNYFIIEGHTNAPELYINNVKVELKDGVFVYEFKLNKGPNKITITALKNEYLQTEYVATVTRNVTSSHEDSVNKDKMINTLVVGLLVSLVGIITIIMFVLPKKHFTWMKLLVFTNILMWIASACGWTQFILRKIFEGSQEYILLALESLKAAKEYLSTTTTIMIWTIIITSFAFVSTVATIVISCIKRAKKKKIQ